MRAQMSQRRSAKSLLRISAVNTRSSAGGYELVFLCSPLAHLPVASEQSAGIENPCLTVV